MAKGFCKMPVTKLHRELHSKFKDSNKANRLYYFTKMKEFDLAFGDKVMYNEEGEPTFESLLRFIDKDALRDDVLTSTYEKGLNAEMPETNTGVLRRVVDFNKQNTGFVALVEDSNSTMSKIKVVRKNDESEAKAKILEENLTNFERIDTFMQHLGIGIKILDPTYFHGEDALTISSNANPLNNGLFGVINIANNLAGIRSVTEEFGHFIVECCRTNPVIQRCEDFLNNSEGTLKDILGNDYTNVVEYYKRKGREDLVAREALGRILAKDLEGGVFNTNTNSIFGRAINVLEDYTDRFVLDTNEKITSYNTLLTQLRKTASDFFEKGTLTEETRNFLTRMGDTLAHTSEDFGNNVDKIMEKLRNRVSKYAAVYEDTNTDVVDTLKQIFNQGKQMSPTQQATLKSIYFEYIKNPNSLHADLLMRIIQYKSIIGSSNILIGKEITNMIRLFDEMKQKNFSMEDIIRNSHIIMRTKNLLLTYSESLDDFLVELTDADFISDFDEEEKKLLNALSDDVTKLLQRLTSAKSKIESMTFELLNQFYNDTFNPDGSGVITMKGTTLHKEHVISLANVLENCYGDCNIVDRLMNTGYNSSDLLLQLVSTKIKQQQEKIRLWTEDEIHNLEHLHDEYGSETSHIYQYDEKGVPTGYYVNPYNIDFKKFDDAQKAYEAEINSKQYLSDDEKSIYIARWRKSNTRPVQVSTYKLENNRWVKADAKVTIRIPRDDPRWHSDGYSKLDSRQKELVDKLLEYKHKLDYINGLTGNFRPFTCVQRTVGSITERIITGRGTAQEILKRGFQYTDEDVSEYGDVMTEKMMENDTPFFARIKQKIERIFQGNDEESEKEIKMLTDFEGEIYRKVPKNYVNALTDLSQLSTSTFDNLLHYTAATFQHEGMHQIADLMELTLAQNEKRNRLAFDYKGRQLKTRVGDKLEPVAYNMYGANITKQMKDIINMQLYSEYKEKGAEILNGTVPVSKLVDGTLRLVSISMLGWSPFTGINNVVVGKSQMLIQAYGSEYYTWDDWHKADFEYVRLLQEYLGELGNPFKQSKMALLEQTFNPQNDWMKSIRKDVYKSKSLKIFEKIAGPSFMMEAGEHHMKFSTLFAVLYGMKMLDANGNETNLYESLEEVEVKNTQGECTHKELRIKEGYKKLDGTEFVLHPKGGKGRTDLQMVTDRMTITNHRMHGIYDQQDYILAKKYALGRIFLLYRNFMFPFFSRRWKGVNANRHGMPQYWNIQLNSADEGYYVTTFKFLKQMFMPNIDELKECGKLSDRLELICAGLDESEKANLKEMLAEAVSTMLTWAMLFFVYRDWDDDEGVWVSRAANYFLRRLQTEITYGWNPATLMDILQSPTPVMGPMKDIARIIQSIGDDHILKSGPYKGKTRFEANLRRGLPIWPNIIDFIHLDTEDKRYKVFQDSWLYKNSKEKEQDEAIQEND